MYRKIDDVVESVRNSKNGCTLIIGAGCSAKAGIPTANEFIKIIRKAFRLAYKRAEEKIYKCDLPESDGRIERR